MEDNYRNITLLKNIRCDLKQIKLSGVFLLIYGVLSIISDMYLMVYARDWNVENVKLSDGKLLPLNFNVDIFRIIFSFDSMIKVLMSYMAIELIYLRKLSICNLAGINRDEY